MTPVCFTLFMALKFLGSEVCMESTLSTSRFFWSFYSWKMWPYIGVLLGTTYISGTTVTAFTSWCLTWVLPKTTGTNHSSHINTKSVQTVLATFLIPTWEAGQWTWFPTTPKGLLWKLLKNKSKHWMWRNSWGKLGWIPAFWCNKSSDSYLFYEIQKISLENLFMEQLSSSGFLYLKKYNKCPQSLMYLILPTFSEIEITDNSQGCFHVDLFKNYFGGRVLS